MTNRTSTEHGQTEEQRIESARARLEEIKKLLAPFGKQRQFKKVSTKGRWVESSSGCEALCEPDSGNLEGSQKNSNE